MQQHNAAPRQHQPIGKVGMSTQHSSRWTVIGNGKDKYHVLCRCACGNVRQVLRKNMECGGSLSCGCLRKELLTTHGMSRTRLHWVWSQMYERATNPNHKNADRYSGRGIGVCERWKTFENFLADMGPPPDGMTLDRVDNDKGYWCGKPECPECGPAGREPNCRWATRAEQNRNHSRNRNYIYKGRTQCLTDWAAEFNLDAPTLRSRLNRGWNFERAVLTPLDNRGGVRKPK